jgi:hypothetical protein
MTVYRCTPREEGEWDREREREREREGKGRALLSEREARKAQATPVAAKHVTRPERAVPS